MFRHIPAELFLWSNRAFRVFHGGLMALFEGFWMGLLPETALDVISEKSYGDGAQYTRSQYLDAGLHFWEELALRTHFPTGGRVLVASAGGGRELIALSRSGYQAAGFECSRAMVEAGRLGLAERAIAATLDWAPPSVAPQIGGEFDAAIVGWNGYGYISPRARRIKFLRDIKVQLRPGSPILVSTALRTPPARTMVWTARIANVIRRCTLRDAVFETGDSFSGGRPKLHFTAQQLKRELIEAGYAITDFYSWGGYGAVVARVQAGE